MMLHRSDDGVWTATEDAAPAGRGTHPDFLEALPRYMTAFDSAFTRARAANEFDFLLTLFRVRGTQDAGWDPYETTQRIIPSMVRLHERLTSGEEQRYLQLWIYGHILEASDPYEIIANLVAISGGESYNFERFPPHKNGRPMSPGEKIQKLDAMAAKVGMPGLALPFREPWNRELRNAVFHSDYALHGTAVRTMAPLRNYSHEEIAALVNRAVALYYAIKLLCKTAIESYTAPKIIPVPVTFSQEAKRAVVLVREGYGAVGLKDNWTPEAVAAGQVPFRLGRFSEDEIALLDADRTRALLPARPGKPENELF